MLEIMIFRKLLFCFIMTICFMAYAKSITVIPDLKKDLACGSSLHPQIWCPGGIRAGLWIGQGNQFDHRYRALLRFDIRQFLIAGKVKKAILKFSLRNIYGKQSVRKFKLQYFTVEKMLLGFNDLADVRVKNTKSFTLNRKIKYPLTLSFDITAELNSVLYKGFGSCSFRILDMRAEKYGNPENIGAGTAIIPNSVKLYITK